MTTLADIATQITAMETAGQQELALLQQLEQLTITLATDLRTALANNDPAALQAIADRLTADQQVIAQAAVTIQQTLDANQPPAAPPTSGGTAP